jgi:tRNA-splicing ligase RtcB
VQLSDKDLRRICRSGANWALERGYATQADLDRTEEKGCIGGAEPQSVSVRALQRGRKQMGTLGAGNHFIEVDLVEEVFHDDAAHAMGLQAGHLVVQIHCGSRGFGHQICSDYVKSFQSVVRKYQIHLPDRELVCAPVESPEGRDYRSAMACAANYAFANRQVLAHHVRNSFEEAFAGKVKDWELQQVYDIAHNMGKIEVHEVDGVDVRVCVHRKGATRAFGPGFAELPPEYRPLGQPVLVPGSMGTASWVLLGTEGSMKHSFGSTCHGAGRVMSRRQAKREIWGNDLREELEQSGICVRAGSMPGLAEEAPRAYKDVDAVINVVVEAGIAERVARLRPLAVVKG